MQAYLDTSLYPIIHSLQLVWDLAHRPAGLTIGAMVGRLIRRYDIFTQLVKTEEIPRLTIDCINIPGRRRVEDSLLGDVLIRPKTLLSAPDLFIGVKFAIPHSPGRTP